MLKEAALATMGDGERLKIVMLNVILEFRMKYGTYTVMDVKTSHILTFHLVHINFAVSSDGMKKYGCRSILHESNDHNVSIVALRSDRNT